ncbi:MAG: hypothetical protein ABIS17_12625 [Casimicrobiaceae bacterium]
MVAGDSHAPSSMVTRAIERDRPPTMLLTAGIAVLIRRRAHVVRTSGFRFGLCCLVVLAPLAQADDTALAAEGILVAKGRLAAEARLAAQARLPAAQARLPAAGRLVADGACRDGRPNGIYELRAADGLLRVLGAFHAGKRTGTFIFWNGSGGRVAAIPYDEDVRNGTIATWHIGTRPAREIGRNLEAPVQRGKVHGTLRSWYRNGKLRILAEYERGTPLAVQAWDEAGRALPEAAARRIEDEVMRERDRELDALERLIAEHQPDCNDSANNKRAARSGADTNATPRSSG